MSVAHAASARKLLLPKSLGVDPPAQARIAQRGFQVATLAALGWFALGLESILRPNPMDLRDSLFHIPWIFTIVTFWFIHRVQGASAVRWDRGTFLVLIASMLAVTLGSIGIITRTPNLQPFAFPWGVLVWMIVWDSHLADPSAASILRRSLPAVGTQFSPARDRFESPRVDS